MAPVSVKFRPQNCGAVLRTSAHDQVRRGRSKIITFSNGFWFLRSRSITHADRDGGRKLARLRRGFAARGTSPRRASSQLLIAADKRHAGRAQRLEAALGP